MLPSSVPVSSPMWGITSVMACNLLEMPTRSNGPAATAAAVMPQKRRRVNGAFDMRVYSHLRRRRERGHLSRLAYFEPAVLFVTEGCRRWKGQRRDVSLVRSNRRSRDSDFVRVSGSLSWPYATFSQHAKAARASTRTRTGSRVVRVRLRPLTSASGYELRTAARSRYTASSELRALGSNASARRTGQGLLPSKSICRSVVDLTTVRECQIYTCLIGPVEPESTPLRAALIRLLAPGVTEFPRR